MNNNEKIKQIEAERMVLLSLINSNLEDNKKEYIGNVKELYSVIDCDNKATKEYKAIVESKELINELINEINTAKSKEEIIELRKKLNYYINKIKREINKRGLNQEEIDKYQEKTSFLRKSISKYLSFLKREDKISEIVKLNNDLDNLTDENKDRLKKLIRNEINYNKRNLYAQDPFYVNDNKKEKTVKEASKKVAIVSAVNEEKKNTEVKTVNNSKIKESVLKEQEEFDLWVKEELMKPKKKNNNDYEEFSLDVAPKKEKVVDEKSFNFDFSNDEIKNSYGLNDSIYSARANENSKYVVNDTEERNTITDLTSIETRINGFRKNYNIVDMYQYNTSFFNNLCVAIKNVPRCIKNKKTIDLMKNDYHTYYSGDDLYSYIQYTKKRNSIMRSFGQIFSLTKLYSRENEALNDHDKCMRWIIDYYNKNSFNFNDTSKIL